MGTSQLAALAVAIPAVFLAVQRLLEPPFVAWLSRTIVRDLTALAPDASRQDTLVAMSRANLHANAWNMVAISARLALALAAFDLLRDLRLHIADSITGLWPATTDVTLAWLFVAQMMAQLDQRLITRALELAEALVPTAAELRTHLSVAAGRRHVALVWGLILLFLLIASNRITWLTSDRILDAHWYAPWGVTRPYAQATKICLAEQSEWNGNSGRLENRIVPMPAVGIRFADGSYWTTAAYNQWHGVSVQLVHELAQRVSQQSNVPITKVDTVYRDESAKTERWRVQRGYAPSPCAEEAS